MGMYGVCALLCAIGLFFIVMSYGASRAGRSGVPFTGAVFIAAGFLLTPLKWLAFLALIDPGFLMITLMIKDNIDYKKAVPLFDKAFSDGGYQPPREAAPQTPAQQDTGFTDLTFTDDALETIVDKAVGVKLGARGLRSIVESVMMDAMFEVPSKRVKKFEVTAEYVNSQLDKAYLK